MVMTDERLYTAEDIAEMMHVTVQTVRMWLRDHRLQGFHPAGPKSHWLVRASELDRFIREREAAERELGEGRR
jgi:excisionase family DNA binding protein